MKPNRVHFALLWLLIFSFLLVTKEGLATTQEQKHTAVDLGAGLQSTYGILGGGARYFLTEKHDIHLSAGFDFSGFVLGLGSRYYVPTQNTKCLFLFSCKPNYYFGGTLLRSAGATTSAIGSDTTSTYKQSEGLAANAAVGLFNVFGDSFTMGFELGYRKWLSRPQVSFESGTFQPSTQSSIERISDDSINVAMTIGWLL